MKNNFFVILISFLIMVVNTSVLASDDVDMGYESLKNNNLKKAKQYFQIALSNHKDSIDAKLGLANVYFRYGSYTRTQGLTEDILSKQPKHIKALMLQGRLYMKSGKWAQAQDIYEMIIGLNQENLQAYGYLSQVLQSQGKFDEKKVVYEKIKHLQGRP